MTVTEAFASRDDEKERGRCLVEQGFTPSLARTAIRERSVERIPLSIWIVDNSASMLEADGQRLVETASHHDVRFERCTRWEELRETVYYHAQLSALLEVPSKFVLLNRPAACPQELSIAERGPDYVQEDLRRFMTCFESIVPHGVTPLTTHLRNIYQSIYHVKARTLVVIATDGRPTDHNGYTSPTMDNEFVTALRQLQAKASIVIRLCTKEAPTLSYYQKLKSKHELSVQVLVDYEGEAKKIYKHNPWLTYCLCLHRCREMGMSSYGRHEWLNALHERPLSAWEIVDALQVLGLDTSNPANHHEKSRYYTIPATTGDRYWKMFCQQVETRQKPLLQTVERARAFGGGEAVKRTIKNVFLPWNPIRKRPTAWIDIKRLRRHRSEDDDFGSIVIILVVVLAIVIYCWREAW